MDLHLWGTDSGPPGECAIPAYGDPHPNRDDYGYHHPDAASAHPDPHANGQPNANLHTHSDHYADEDIPVYRTNQPATAKAG